MNKNFIKINDNTYIVTTDEGDSLTYKVNDNVDKESFNEVLTTENDISFLQKQLWDLECKKSNIREHQQFSKKVYLKGLPILFLLFEGIYLLLAQSSPNLQSILFSLSSSFLSTIAFNVGFNGTIVGNKNKIEKLSSKIKDTESELDTLYKKIELLKNKTNYQEVENNTVYEVKPIDRRYEEDITKKALTKKLTKQI